jgi:hypothetical protein
MDGGAMRADVAGPALLDRMADADTNAMARKLVDAGEGEWAGDPIVPNVVGLLRPGTNRAWLVVYLADDDFEVSTDMEDRMIGENA